METTFSKGLLEALNNSMQIAKNTKIKVSTPLVLFKGILDNDESPIYDYLLEETCYSNADFEDCFLQVLYDRDVITAIEEISKETKKAQEGEQDSQAESEKAEDSVLQKVSEEVAEVNPDPEIDIQYYFKLDETGAVLYYDEECATLIMKAIQYGEESDSHMVTVEHMLKAMCTGTIPKDILEFLRNLGVDIKDFKKVFGENDETAGKDDFIPSELKSCLQIWNVKVNPKRPCTILGRDKECKELWTTLQKKTKKNAILIGDPGVGKTAIVKKITDDIVRGTCPEQFKNFYIVNLDVSSIIAGTTYRGQAEEKFALLIDFLNKHENVILFIDEIHLILGAGATEDNPMDLSNALKPVLAEEKVRVIGATTTAEYERYFSRDGAVKRRFKTIEVKEPRSHEVFPMIKNAIAELSRYHEVRISRQMVDYIILNSACFNYETKNPDRTLDLIDLSMVSAKNSGKKVVDKESVLENFKINFKQFEKMDIESKKATAYHEAGHYIVWRLSGRITDYKVIAVSIMPAENYMGVNILEETDNVQGKAYMDYYIDEIAVDLGGRVAEKMFTGEIGSGASADLEMATRVAYEVVFSYGMSKAGINRAYFDDETHRMISENKINEMNREMDEIISKAEKRAEEILKSNEKILKKMVGLLMKKGILDERELNKLFEEYELVVSK